MAMDRKVLGLALAGLSVALGMAELAAGKQVARGLGVPRHSGTVRAFGLRELATGAALLARPTSSTAVWGRVAGDIVDLGSLGAASRAQGAKSGPLLAAAAFVAGALLLDVASALAMQGDDRPA